MPLPSSGPLSLSDIQGEFGGSNPISLSEYYAGGGLVPAGTTGTYGAVPSSGAISIQNFYGTSAFALAFNNAEAIGIYSGTNSVPAYSAYTPNTNATCTKVFGGSSTSSSGPTAWGSPTGGTPGNNFETRLYISSAYGAGQWPGNYLRFAGVSYADGFVGFTPWYSLSSNRTIEAYAEGQTAEIIGTLYIRNTSSLVEISRSFSVFADTTY
jgi:hypothetical protein